MGSYASMHILKKAIASGNPAAIAAAVGGDLENAIVAATPGGIEKQEAAGQAQLVGTLGMLPIKCPRKELESLGFVFGANIDDLFVSVSFPAGWSKKATDHAMWSDLLDDQGRKRGSIFYKAAFYDRSSHMDLDTRYLVGVDYHDADGAVHDWKSGKQPTLRSVTVRDRATGENLFESPKYARDDYNASDNCTQEARTWLRERYPEADDVLAYW